ncbi:hypothetical protein DL96DRAFT_1607510 [Flagelloscypha sp. PMI_526]|nr:hypothetical protein DL96DRAFT_1607510 [Flagelloscypha sp. PMI_526]
MSLGTITNPIEINRFVEAMAICAMRCPRLKKLSLHGLSSTLGDIAHYLPQLNSYMWSLGTSLNYSKRHPVFSLRELDFAFTNGILQNQVVDGIITSVSLDILSTGTPPSLNVLLISGYSSSSRVEGTTVSLISSDLITSLGICVNLDILNLSLPIDLSDSEIETLVKNLRRLHKLILGLENDYVQYGRRKNIIPSATLAALGTVAQYCPNLMDVYIPVDARVPPTLPPTPTGTTSNTKLTELQVTNSLIDKDVEGVTKRRYVHGDDERWNQVQELLWTNKESIEKPEWKKKSMSGFARFA